MTHLRHEHGSWRNLHVMAKFEILKEGQRLSHADVSVHLEAHVGHRAAWIEISHDILGDDVQSRGLETIRWAS